MIKEDTDSLTYLFEELEEAPHCKTTHSHPGVHKWAGDCSHDVVALLSYCEGEGWICTNTLKGIKHALPICATCGKLKDECWKVYPL